MKLLGQDLVLDLFVDVFYISVFYFAKESNIVRYYYSTLNETMLLKLYMKSCRTFFFSLFK